MNIKRLFLFIGLSLATCASSLFCLNNSFFAKPAVEAKADASPANTTIYVEVCDGWTAYNAVAKLYVTPASSSWISATTIKTATADQHALYSFNLPAGVTSFFIYRMNPDKPSESGGVWNSTAAISYSSSYNYYNVTSLNGYDCPYTPGWMNVFQRGSDNYKDFQLTVINEDYNWFDNSASTWIRFWDGTEIRFNRVISYYGSAIYTNTLKCNTLGGYSDPAIYAAGFNIFRKSSDGSETWSQTGNWAFTYDNKDMNAFVIKAKTDDAQFYNGEGQSKVIGDEYNAMAYGIFFLETTNSICKDKEEDNNYSALSGVWTKLEGAANASTNGTYLLKTEEEIAAFETSTEGYTHDAYLRYCHIVGKYPSLKNYLGITPLFANRTIANDTLNNSSSMIIFAVIAVISVAGVVLVIKKRKEIER